jgi:glucose-1-phosphate thymidylyltransferase
MIESGMKIGYVEIKGWWKDTGTPEEFLSCNMMALENIPIRGDHSRSKYWRALIESDASVDENSKIMGPCFIGSGADVKNSYIGPYTSIGRRCKVNNCHIENSIVMDDVSIDLDSRIMIKDSLIGSSSKIGSNGENSRSFKFIVGRDSKVEI